MSVQIIVTLDMSDEQYGESFANDPDAVAGTLAARLEAIYGDAGEVALAGNVWVSDDYGRSSRVGI